MKTERGTCLPREASALALWAYCIMPYCSAVVMLFCRVVLGWSDVPFLEAWTLTILAAIIGRYLVYGLQMLYNWRTGIDWRMAVCDGITVLIGTLAVVFLGGSLSWFWRGYAIVAWISAGLLVVVLLPAMARDVNMWWQTGNGDIPCQSFREYVKERDTNVSL